ncbi:MAG: hypothetical protein AAF368_14845, partial [Planctomycetota bacterium]
MPSSPETPGQAPSQSLAEEANLAPGLSEERPASELGREALAARSFGQKLAGGLRALWRIPALGIVTTVLYLLWTTTKLIGG